MSEFGIRVIYLDLLLILLLLHLLLDFWHSLIIFGGQWKNCQTKISSCHLTKLYTEENPLSSKRIEIDKMWRIKHGFKVENLSCLILRLNLGSDFIFFIKNKLYSLFKSIKYYKFIKNKKDKSSNKLKTLILIKSNRKVHKQPTNRLYSSL